MKSFNEHKNVKREELKEGDPLDDLTNLLWVGAAAGGLYGLTKAWDKWGKGSTAASWLAVTDKQKAKVAQDKIDKADTKAKEKETMAAADEVGGIDNIGDAQKFFDKHGRAPKGYQEYPDKSKKVMSNDDVEKEKEIAAKEKEKTAASTAKISKSGMSGQKKKQALGKQSLGKVDKEKQAALKAKLKAKKAGAGKEEFQKFALHELISLTGENRIQLLEELVLEETMSLEESNELQAIMALDDAGIKAEINRKGQVVIKKKDKKKAHKALEKSFTKGGWPPLKLEGVDEHKGTEPHKHPHEDEELDEASSKKARNKAADEIEAIADKGGAEAPALFSLASKLRKGTHSTTGLKLSKKVTAILKVNRIKEDVQKQRTAYEVVSEARNRVAKNKPEWETEDSRLS